MKKTVGARDVTAFARFLSAEERARATVEKYCRDTDRFCRFAGGRRLSKELVVGFKQMLCERYAPRSVNSMLAAVNGFLAFIGRGDLRVKRLRLQRQMFCARERELTRAEYERLVSAARRQGGERLSLLLQTLGSTGIRIGELRFVTAEAVRGGKAVVSAKGKTRVVMLPRRLRALLRQYCREKGITGGPVFRTRAGRPVDRSNVWAEMKRLCGPAGVARQKVFPHNLRHLFARAFYSVEKDICRLADMLGHASVETTRIYIVSSGEEHERQLEMLGLVT